MSILYAKEERIEDSRGRYVYAVLRRYKKTSWSNSAKKFVTSIYWDAWLKDKKTSCFILFKGSYTRKKDAIGAVKKYLTI
jgi:hypothetical protein